LAGQKSPEKGISIIISGMPAVGKTTLAQALAQRFGLTLLSGGDVLKEMAEERGYRVTGLEWWDTPEGMRFLNERQGNPEFDREVDRRLKLAVERGGVVVTSYPLPWLTDKGVKFWLKASQASRAARMARRDRIPLEEALRIVRVRDEENRALYQQLYGIRFGEDLSVFNYVIDTDPLSEAAVAEVVIRIVSYLVGGP
jgi:cytidylate kinase